MYYSMSIAAHSWVFVYWKEIIKEIKVISVCI